MAQRILIATDGSELSRRATSVGVELARSLGASVVGCAALPVYPYHGVGGGRAGRAGVPGTGGRRSEPTSRRHGACGRRGRGRFHRRAARGQPRRHHPAHGRHRAL